jgi:hypothetical protein
MNLIYLGTPGVGENIQMIPAWRDWQKVGATPPAALFVYLPETQANSGIFTDILPNMVAKPWPLRWAKDGSVILDTPLLESISGIHAVSPGETTHIKSRQNILIETTVPVPSMIVIEPRYACPGHHSVPDGNGVMLNGAPPTDTTFQLHMPVAGVHMADILLCSGSNEPMRSIPPSVFVNLAKHLDVALHGGAALPKQKKLALFLANARYKEALDQMWPEWKDKVLMCYEDTGTGQSLKHCAKIIGLSHITISPDTGTAHIALAASMMAPDKHHLIFLPTREHHASVFSLQQEPFFTHVRKHDPHCDRTCRGCSVAPVPTVPKNYPWSLRCSRSSSVPCLMLNEANCHGLTEIAMAHLLALKSGSKCATATTV